MPSSPKFRGTFRNKGVVEIFQKIKAEHSAEAYCHITVTGKVKINLQCHSCCVDPGENYRFVGCSVKGSTEGAYGVSQKYFFSETYSKFHHTGSELFGAVGTGFQLTLNIRISYDRSCDKLGEQSNIAGKIYGVFLCFGTVVNINLITQYLECIKAYTDGQDDP